MMLLIPYTKRNKLMLLMNLSQHPGVSDAQAITALLFSNFGIENANLIVVTFLRATSGNGKVITLLSELHFGDPSLYFLNLMVLQTC